MTANPGGKTATGTASPLTITGLTNGTGYSFTVRATNSIGMSYPKTPSNSVVPATTPGAPTALLATAGARQATVAFDPPTSKAAAPSPRTP